MTSTIRQAIELAIAAHVDANGKYLTGDNRAILTDAVYDAIKDAVPSYTRRADSWIASENGTDIIATGSSKAAAVKAWAEKFGIENPGPGRQMSAGMYHFAAVQDGKPYSVWISKNEG